MHSLSIPFMKTISIYTRICLKQRLSVLILPTLILKQWSTLSYPRYLNNNCSRVSSNIDPRAIVTAEGRASRQEKREAWCCKGQYCFLELGCGGYRCVQVLRLSWVWGLTCSLSLSLDLTPLANTSISHYIFVTTISIQDLPHKLIRLLNKKSSCKYTPVSKDTYLFSTCV